ncbi:MAG TPA: DUF2339 domain-containing protein, partial [Gemmatimonadaceae bacterium]
MPLRSNARSLDFEGLLGRYGMLAIAVLAAVAAVGTFLSWAIHNGYLHVGPAGRVMIGLAAAAALGTWGFVLRRRERSFGSTILSLALVIVQLCAYAAGPGFELVPIPVAFAGAAMISWALAIFAHAEDDEPLWCVGFGGAALAPFVTSNGSGNVYGLLIYGAVVLLPACFAISHRDWPVGWRVFYAVAAVYATAGATIAHRSGVWGFVVAYAFPFVIAFAGVVPFAAEHRKHAALRWLAILGAICSLATPTLGDGTRGIVVGTLVLSVALWLYVLDTLASVPQSSLFRSARANPTALDWVDIVVIPAFIISEAANGFHDTTRPLVVLGVSLVLYGIFTWRRSVSTLLDAAAFGVAASACGIVGLIALEEPLGRLAAFVALAVVLLLVAHRVRPSVTWLATGGFVLGATALASAIAMSDRTPYAYIPFSTEPSWTAFVVLVGLIIVARSWSMLRVATRTAMGERPEWSYVGPARRLIVSATLAPWIWAFVWVLIELSMAYSASTSTLLLVTYFAVTGVACVGAGRARRSARLRQTGLCLALLAAGTAFYGAT